MLEAQSEYGKLHPPSTIKSLLSGLNPISLAIHICLLIYIFMSINLLYIYYLTHFIHITKVAVFHTAFQLYLPCISSLQHYNFPPIFPTILQLPYCSITSLYIILCFPACVFYNNETTQHKPASRNTMLGRSITRSLTHTKIFIPIFTISSNIYYISLCLHVLYVPVCVFV